MTSVVLLRDHWHTFSDFALHYTTVGLQYLSGSQKPVPQTFNPAMIRSSLDALRRLPSCRTTRRFAMHPGTVVAKKLILLTVKSTTPPCFVQKMSSITNWKTASQQGNPIERIEMRQFEDISWCGVTLPLSQDLPGYMNWCGVQTDSCVHVTLPCF